MTELQSAQTGVAAGTVSAVALARLSSFQRREAIEDLVADTVNAQRGSDLTEVLAGQAAFADLGLTSLRLTRVRQQLERALDLDIDATAVFNHPTVDSLVDYLDELVSATNGGTS